MSFMCSSMQLQRGKYGLLTLHVCYVYANSADTWPYRVQTFYTSYLHVHVCILYHKGIYDHHDFVHLPLTCYHSTLHVPSAAWTLPLCHPLPSPHHHCDIGWCQPAEGGYSRCFTIEICMQNALEEILFVFVFFFGRRGWLVDFHFDSKFPVQ